MIKKNKIKMYWEYFKYIMEHKKNVFKTCWKRRLYIHAFTHDLSKFSPYEFSQYAESFYGEKDCKKCKDYNNCNYNQIGLGAGNWAKQCNDYKYKDFNKAWEHHFKVNKHHWNYWCYDWNLYKNNMITLEDAKLPIPNEMPYKYIIQMICDWDAMSLKFGGTSQEFYMKNQDKIEMNSISRLMLELNLGLIGGEGVIAGMRWKDWCQRTGKSMEEDLVELGYIK